MDTKDKTPPASAIEEDLSAEEHAIHEHALEQQAGQTAPQGDDDLPKVQADRDR